MRRTSRVFVTALAVAIGFASSATCLAAIAQMSDQSHHTCCEAMGQDCGADPTPVQMDCCSVQSADLVRPAGVTPAVSPLAWSLVAPFVAEPTSTGSLPGAAPFDPGAPKPSSTPTYVLISVFRL